MQKLSAKVLVTRNILFSKLQPSVRNASESRKADFKTLNAFFSNLHFSTRLAVELEQFLSNRPEIFTVSVRLNYLQK